MYSGYTKGMETCEFNIFNIKSLRFYPIQINPMISIVFLSSVQSLSHVWLFATPWIAARQASLSSRAVKKKKKKKEDTHKYRFLLSIIFFFSKFLHSYLGFSYYSPFYFMQNCLISTWITQFWPQLYFLYSL